MSTPYGSSPDSGPEKIPEVWTLVNAGYRLPQVHEHVRLGWPSNRILTSAPGAVLTAGVGMNCDLIYERRKIANKQHADTIGTKQNGKTVH